MKNKRYRLALLGLLLLIAGLAGTVAIAQAPAHLVVNTAFLNVRSGPGAGYAILTVVPGGTTLPVIARNENMTWYQVQSPAGDGYVNSNYTVRRGDFSGIPWDSPVNLPSGLTTAAAAVAPGDAHVVVNTAFLNVRQGPGVGHPVVAVVPGGTVLPVLEISLDGHWYMVETAAGNGWLRHMYTITRGNYDDVTQTGISPHIHSVSDSAILGRAPHLVVNTAYLNIRSGPGVGNGIILTVPGGSRLLVTGGAGNGNWYEIETNSGPGWVNASYTAARGDFSRVPSASSRLNGATPRAITNIARLHIRSGPGRSYSSMTIVPAGSVLEITGMSSDGIWYQVNGDFGTGWLHGSFVVTRGNVGVMGMTG
ncbi:MAG: SH3 domain-containing protein [Chloroflexi bacterium]|nr:SH3 domain-containing protein [Chloroflexota bacterium]MCY3581454.1 SH3 domain-containing protein [Chloroflexota bacterium]MCY3717305.1 SH3 domain-containing protein [Chloroflexota bacterium]MDE2649222.1 SH3 domain-containing protein [Chloroflexota bacterium]